MKTVYNNLFEPPVNYNVGRNPFSIVSGDFNNDGRLDLVNANYWEGYLSILYGYGNGTFQNPYSITQFPSGTLAVDMVTADFNKDGNLDIACTKDASGAGVAVILGKGDGTFQPYVDYYVDAWSTGLTVNDFNNDNIPDLANANLLSGSVTVLIGKGDGTFQLANSYPVGNHARNIISSDFNNDNMPDLVVTSDQGVSILFGQNNGAFEPAIDLDNIPGGSFVAADFNLDKLMDLVSAGSNTIAVAFGKGNGQFEDPINYPVDHGFTGINHAAVTADFNGDNILDLAVGNANFNSIVVLIGSKCGIFQPLSYYTSGNYSQGLTAGDFNNDSWMDLATVNSVDNTISVLMNEGV